MKLKSIISFTTALVLSASSFFTTFPTTYADESEDNIVYSDFEDGNMGSWVMFGGGKLELEENLAHTGTKCIKASERKQQYQGPSINFDDVFVAGETYYFDAWLYHEAVAPITMTWTIKYRYEDENDRYSSIHSQEVAPGEWTQFTKSITIPEEAIGYTIYFECMDGTLDFYVDDVTISGKTAEGSDKFSQDIEYQESYLFDFETGVEKWNPRGSSIKLIHTDEYSNTGKYSIYSTGRTATWNGPTVSISDKIRREKSYHYSTSVMYNGEEYEDSHVFRLELQYTMDGVDKYNLIAEKEIKKGKWTTIEGYYTVPDKAENISIYVQTANLEEGQEITDNDCMSFYIDTVQITDGDIMLENQRHKLLLEFLIVLAVLVVLGIVAYFIGKRIKKNSTALKLVSIDAMTQVFNRNSYEKKIEELENDVEQCKSLYYALCDVNFLKYINDNHGHEKGDEAITRCAKMLDSATGAECKVYRTGGDEFVCISKTPIDDKIRNAIVEEAKNDKGYPFAVACGFAVYDEENCNDIKAIISQCDKNMYEDKQKIKAANQEYSRK